MEVTRRQLNRATLARQLLLARAPLGAAEAISSLGGLQAQEAGPPFLGLWTRLDGFDASQLGAALQQRTVVRATLMRATLHLMTAADYLAFRLPLQPVLTRAMRVLGKRADGLDLDRVVAVAGAALDEAPRTFGQLRSLLAARFPDVDERALGYAMRMNLPLVMVPTGDRWAFPADATFTPAEAWLDGTLIANDAPHELVRRYLAAFGPATAADVQEWSGLQGARAVLAELRPELATLRDERGRELFDLASSPRPDSDVPAPLRLLPEFDSLVLAHADRSRVLADEHRAAVVTRNLRVRATLLWDGFVHGTWDVTVTRTRAVVRVSLFTPLPRRAGDDLAREAEAAARFVAGGDRTFDLEVT